ncbi:NAD(P)-dependent oxidoreductase [Geothermobacter hydrogeniphilus]|uniref:NAD(P)-dependent oxidoreductase n=1 Tax=Geothermobacter hydrogeniphilus TaxID=1969733 RepID=A0A2K2HCX0_9BACT|nr:NAD-dependent epimerase/dehydratase family protein [Geothermobacter hydrogeniphilus]PNU21155.1 NAD(P)-dependent oxidoreductase [Geothermobacter hydrogeniphilus]
MLLLTGSRGFIGRALTARLRQQELEYREINSERGGVTRPDNFRPFTACGIRHVFHLAARVFVPDSWREPGAFFHTNLTGTQNVLEFCRATGAALTYVSAYLYGPPEKLPVVEDHPLRPDNPYAQSKVLAEQLCRFYAREFNLPVTILRPFNVYGPGQDRRFLVPWIIHQALHAERITLRDLRPRRDFVFIDDLVDALLLTLTPQPGLTTLNIGSGTSISVAETVARVQSLLGIDKEVTTENVRRKNELDDVVADISRATRMIGWRPKTSLEQGLKSMIEELRTPRGDRQGGSHAAGG